MKNVILSAIAGAALTVAGAVHAAGVPAFDDFGPFADPTFGGSGINGPDVNIAITTLLDGGNTITLALAATPRFNNPAVGDDGAGTYSAQPGRATPPSSTIPGALWNFDYFIDIAGGGVLTDYDFSLDYDFGPAAGAPSASDTGTLSGATLAILGGQGNPLTGVVDPTATRTEGSQNLDFGFLASSVPGFIDAPTSSFNPFSGGLYSFELSASSLSGDLLGSTAINVSVVPLPAGLPLLVAGLGALAFLRRKRTA